VKLVTVLPVKLSKITSIVFRHLAGVVDVCLIPEVPFELDRLLDHVAKIVDKRGHVVICTAEGAGQVRSKAFWPGDDLSDCACQFRRAYWCCGQTHSCSGGRIARPMCLLEGHCFTCTPSPLRMCCSYRDSAPLSHADMLCLERTSAWSSNVSMELWHALIGVIRPIAHLRRRPWGRTWSGTTQAAIPS